MLLGFDINVIDWNSDVLVWLFRIVVAAICGLGIGLERTARSKEAGMRTHTIVCMAAALMMIVSKYGFADLANAVNGTRGADPARIAAQIVSGIGFLGAGIIFYKRDLLHGLTTAAGIWATAAIGMAIGSGMVVIGVIAAILLVAIQILLHKSVKFVRKNDICLLRISAEIDTDDKFKELNNVLKITRVERIKTIKENEQTIVEIEAISIESWTPQSLYIATLQLPYVKSIEKLEEA